MENIASGTFQVKVLPVGADENKEQGIGRMLIDKEFFGDLEGVSNGQMLSFGSLAKGSAGYVAMEKVNGTLKGLKGVLRFSTPAL